jgi:3-(3-hydroxy-phenyl)propionate hydroxylase
MDAPIGVRGGTGWLLNELGGSFTLLCFGAEPGAQERLSELPVPVEVVRVLPEGSPERPGRVIVDSLGKMARDLQASPNACLLFRPDQHLAAVWHDFDPGRVCSAVMHCIGR